MLEQNILWWPRRVRPLRPGPKLKAASANQKAEAAFCEPLRLIEKPKRPFLPAAAHYKAEAAWQKAASALPLATVDN